MQKVSYKLHILALSAVYVLSGAVITLPKPLSDGGSLPALLTAFLFSLLFLLAVYKISLRLENVSRDNKGVKILYIILALSCFLDSAMIFSEVADFVDLIMLPDQKKYMTVILLFICVLWISLNKISAVMKFSVPIFFIAVITVLLFFFLSLKQMNFENIELKESVFKKDILKEALYYFLKIFLPLINLSAFIFLFKKEEKRAKYSFLGILSGSLLIFICVFQIISVFGGALTADIEFPYSAVISTVNIGNIFTRMDGAAYFLFIGLFLVRTGTDLKVISDIAKNLGIKSKMLTSVISSLIITLAAVAIF